MKRLPTLVHFLGVILPAFLVGLFILNSCVSSTPAAVNGINDQPLDGEAISTPNRNLYHSLICQIQIKL